MTLRQSHMTGSAMLARAPLPIPASWDPTGGRPNISNSTHWAFERCWAREGESL
jgi:hypothetical protein